FRSRLEARWAVFFDRLGIEWQYEPQGFVLPGGRHYLPDFLLVESGTWIEVKGHPSLVSEDFLMEASSALPDDNGQGECVHGLMLLTGIPDASTACNDFSWPVYVGGGADHYGFGSYKKNRRPWWHDNSGFPNKDDLPSMSLEEEMREDVRRAYTAARSARFEHGQRG